MEIGSDNHELAKTTPLMLPNQLEPDNPLWRFALSFWQQTGVQDNCLALQEQGWSVTRILCAGWLAVHGHRYSGDEDDTLKAWRKRVTAALRSVRQALPKHHDACQSLRPDVASLELNAERIELALAWQTLMINNSETCDMHGRHALIQRNLEAAAPVTGLSRCTRPYLNSLARALAEFSKGEPLP
ncbi:TIGR02444 family protein [Marinobacter salinisoli]|uniref:TIGR02444 family protein n=1 Tax=Marinobacter salinisoli TaxID=2769486 RepID=A0ABX7MTZ0_9GAMM|nr:TIGR02444 family protein [Marinobacter salinisoli]QSP95857.1 TIGR02444 family protein [Marinobacter salinisoli]